MELGSLLSKINKSKEKAPKKMLALVIGSETVHSAVWHVEGNQSKIFSLGSVEEYADEQNLIPAADASLSTALETLTQEPDEVILGLPENWVSDDKIASKKQLLVKELLSKLTLKAVGFVVVTEAIVNFLKTKEGTPLTGVLIELTESDATLNLVNLGKIVDNHTVGRSDDLGADVEEGLARFKSVENFPSRMLLFDGNLDLETARQTLLSYSWKDKMLFLHVPKIEILDKDIPVRAVVVSTASENVNQVPEKTTKTTQAQQLAQHGFYSDTDIASKKPKPTAATAKPPDQKVAASEPAPKPSAVKPPDHTSAQQIQQSVPAGKFKLETALSFIKKNLPLKTYLTKIFAGRKLPSIVVIWLAIFVTLLVASVVAYWRLPKATITLFLTPKTIKEEIDFIVESGKSTDPEKNRVRGEVIEVEIEDTLDKDTSGESLVGEKASGKVDLFNKTNKTKKFSAGTVLIGPKQLEFELDGDVTIASQSATDTGITFGKVSVTATSSNVGSESNVNSNVAFTVKGFSVDNFSAKATSDFAGGSSQQIRAVSEEDREELLKELSEKLGQKAEDQLKKDLAEDETLINTGFESEVISQKFTKAVGEEADSVSLTLKLRITTLKFKTQDALILAQSELSDKIPEGFVSLDSAGKIQIDEAYIEEGGGVADISATLGLNLVPKIDQDAMIHYLKGKRPEATESFIKSIPSFSKVDIQLSPKLPSAIATFPHRAENIFIDIQITPID